MKNTWVGNVAQEATTADRLHDLGIFDEADAFFDALEAGEDVLNDHHDPHELAEQLKLQRTS